MRSISGNRMTVAVVLLTLTLCIEAQQPSSLNRNKRANSRSNAEILLDSAEHSINSDLPGAFDYIEQALEKSISTGDRYSEARSYYLLANTNYNLGQYDLAIDYYRKALLLKSYLGSSEFMQIHHKLGLSFERLEQYSEAIAELNTALSHAQRSSDSQNEIQIRYDLARIHVDSKQNNQALQEYKTIMTLEEERNNQRGIAQASNSIGEVYLIQNQTKEAISNYQVAERIADEAEDPSLKSKALRNQGNAYRQSRQYEQELDVRQRSLEISNQMNDADEAAEDNLMIGEVYLETQQPAQALPYFQRSIDLADQSGDYEKKGRSLKKLSEAYGQQGVFDKALTSYQQYAEAMDSTYARRERNLQDNLELVADVSRKLQRIDLLEQDYEITKKTLALLEKEQLISARELRIQRWITYALILLALGLALAAFLIYRSSVQKRRANLLLALRSLRSQMNPHFIFNSLNSVNSYIAANDERKANKYLSDFSRLMRQVLENSKHDFVPVASELEILELYLKLEHSRFSEKFDYSFKVDESLRKPDFSIPPMLIQPYIENAIWHGLRYKQEKGRLDVELKMENSALEVVIRDDGIGRSRSKELKTKHQQQVSSTGLKNTRSRLDIINEVYAAGYKVTIEDLDKEQETGTVVRLYIPLQNHNT